MFGSECDLKMYVVIWGYPPIKIGDLKPPNFDVFRRICNLTATLTFSVFGTKHDIDNRGLVLETTVGGLHRPKIS